MSLEQYDFIYHKVSHRYRDRSTRLSLGNQWDYVSKPTTPVSRIFTLKYSVMKFFENPQLLSPLERRYSADHLDEFYQRHETWKEFLFQHHKFGNVVVRFDQPLELPEGLTGADGAIQPFTVTLREVPL